MSFEYCIPDYGYFALVINCALDRLRNLSGGGSTDTLFSSMPAAVVDGGSLPKEIVASDVLGMDILQQDSAFLDRACAYIFDNYQCIVTYLRDCDMDR